MPYMPTVAPVELTGGAFVSMAGSLGALNQTTISSVAWPSANLAIFVPVRVPVPVVICKLVAASGGTVAAGNFDLGVYDASGNRLVSTGAQARSVNTEHVVDVTDTPIGPGLYYLAMAADGTQNYVMVVPSGSSPVPLQKTRLYGVMGQATAYTLPSTATFAAATLAPIPAVAAYLRGY